MTVRDRRWLSVALAHAIVAGCSEDADDATDRVAIARIVANQAVEMPIPVEAGSSTEDGVLVAGRRTHLSVDLARTGMAGAGPLDLEVFVASRGPEGEAVSGPHSAWMGANEDAVRIDLWVDGEVIVPEGEIAVRVREATGANRSTGPRARWSAQIPEDLDVREVTALDLTIVPVHYVYYEQCAPWDPERVDLEGWRERLLQVLPVADVRWQVAEPLVWPHPLESFDDQRAVANTLGAMADADPTAGRVLVGVGRRCEACDGTCVNGLAGVGSLQMGVAAVYVEVREPDAEPSSTAHEIGHTAGLLHAPCPPGVVGIDPEYPLPDGRIEVPGLGIFDETERDPAETYDMMGACWPRWISRYHWVRLIEAFSSGVLLHYLREGSPFREGSPSGAATTLPAMTSADRQPRIVGFVE